MPYTPSFIKRENQYTSGNEYMISRTYVVKDDPESVGKEYIGYYNITSEELNKPLGSLFIESIPAISDQTDLEQYTP